MKEAHQEVTDLNIYEALLDLSFLVRKINAAEVNLKRLTPIEQALFRFAKGKEVNSFIKNIAVHKCLNDEEVRQAYTSGRIVRARWVLTWKAIPPDERALAAKEALEEGTVAHPDGTKKAKARIVLLTVLNTPRSPIQNSRRHHQRRALWEGHCSTSSPRTTNGR